jgi:hypothetical protein
MSSIKSLFSPDNKTKKTSSKTSPSLFYGLISTVKTLLSPTGNGSNHHDMHDVHDYDVYNNDYMDDVKDDDVYNNDNVEQNIADNSEKLASSSSSSSSSDADEESKSKGTISIITRNNHYHN